MISNRIGILLLAIVVMVGLVLVIGGSGPSRTASGVAMLPGLKADLNKLSSLSLVSDGFEVTLEATEGRWQIKERHGLDADFKRFSSLVNALADAKLLERKTKKPENFDLLGLDESKAEAIHISLKAGGQTYRLISGNNANRKGRYVRLSDSDDGNQVWLTDIGWQLSADPATWLDGDLVDISAESVVAVTITHKNETLALHKVDENWQIKDLPEGAELQYPSITANLSRALTRLGFDDVLSVDQVDFSEAVVARFELVSSEAEVLSQVGAESETEAASEPIILRLAAHEGGYWLKFVEGGSAKNRRWAYKINQLDYENLTKTLADLINVDSLTD